MPFVSIEPDSRIFYAIRSNDGKLHRSKPTILALHPRFFDSEFMSPQYEDGRLTERYNFLVIDQHYHGKTQVPLDDGPYDFWKVSQDTFKVLDALEIETCHIFGSSLGALIAIRMAVLQPSRISSLTLCALARQEENMENMEQYRMALELSCLPDEEGVDQMPRDMVAAGRLNFFGKKEWPEYRHQQWMDTHPFRPSNRKLLEKVYSVQLDRKALDPADWRKVTMPTLIIHGDEDVFYTPEVAQENYDLLSASRYREIHLIKEGAHLLSWTEAAVANDLFLAFLSRHA